MQNAEFMRLIEPHLKGVRTLIDIRMRGTNAKDDIYQETLLAAYAHRTDIKSDEKVRSWLFQIARNKCNDHYRMHWREVTTRDDAIEQKINDLNSRFGRDDPQLYEWDLGIALEALPPFIKDSATRFYLCGERIADIAADTGTPVGTIKRRLHDARKLLRDSLQEETSGEKGSASMARKYPLPLVRPNIRIETLRREKFEVICPEALWMFESVNIGEDIWFGIYDAPDWKLTSIAEAKTLREARIHDVNGVEVLFTDHEIDPERLSERTVFIGIVDGCVKTLAAMQMDNGKTTMTTYLDASFDDQWNSGLPMRFADEGRFTEEGEGVFQTSNSKASIGAGHFVVSVGEKRFECLRVLDIQDGMLMEGYLLKDGHTLLARRYNDRMWKVGPGARYGTTPWDERFPDHARITIDGVVYTHWYDSISTAING